MKAKKRFATLLAMVMLITAFGPTTASAGSYFTWHDYGWYGRYYLNGHIELIYYYGTDLDVTIPARIGAIPVTGFCKNTSSNMGSTVTVIRKQNVRSITFELNITELPMFFASDCPYLETVTLPDSLVTIGEGAFQNCPKLSTINLPEGLKTIGPFAFKECSGLTSIELPTTLQTIADSAFSITGLTSVELPASVRSVDERAFAKCEQLQSITMKEGLQRIGREAFSGCIALRSINVPDSVISIGDGAFRNCTNMTSAKLPNGMQAIPSSLFFECRHLATLALPSSVRIIHDRAFQKCTDLASITLPAGLTTLEDYAFSGSGLKSIHIPGGVTNIGAHAFYKSGGLKTVTMGYGVLTIGESIYNTDTANYDGFAFSGCASGLKITLPSSVYKVYRNAFTEAVESMRYYDGEKQSFDRVEFESQEDKARFIYRSKVSFISERGETPEPLYPYIGEQIILPSMAVISHHFQGWDCDDTTYDGGSKYTVKDDNVTFTAKWFSRVEVVTFITEKGQTPEAQYLGYCETAVEPAGQMVGNEYLAGWYTTRDCTGEPYNFNTPVTKDLKLYAKWTAAPLIDVNLTGGGGGNKVVFRDKTDSSLIFAALTDSGTVSVTPDAQMVITAASGMEYGGSIVAEVPLNDDMTEVRTFSIVNGQSLYAPNYGSHTTVNIAFTSSPRVVANAVADDGLNADALWTLTDGYDPPHTLTDGSLVTVPVDGMADTRNDLTLTLTVPEGYGCDGTICNGDDSITVSEGITSYHITPQGVVTLNLHFYNKANYVALTFRSGRSDGRFFTQKYPKGENAPDSFIAPDCPYTYSTAVFNHWQSTTGDLEAGAAAALPQMDTEYTAVWDAARFLYFRANGGSGEMEKMLVLEKDGYAATVPECAYTQSGYAFTGWNTKANGRGTNYQPGDTITLTGATYLYAQWEEAYTVRLYANYTGSGVSYVMQRVAKGESAALETPFTREGCQLTGWNTGSSGSGTAYAVGATITPTANMNLYAQWHEHDYRFDSFIWSADSTAAQVKLVCGNDETHITYVDAEMAAYAREATCETDACTVYEAIYGSNSETRTVTQAGSTLGHDYGEPVWKWIIQVVETENGEEFEVTAAMEMLCGCCGKSFTWNAAVTSETTAQPAADQPGETAYTATVTVDGETYTSVYTMEIPALDLPANEAAEALINAIGVVTYTPNCKAAIDIARAFYESLTDEEKAQVTNLAVLEAAEQAYTALTPIDLAVGEEVTVTIDNDGPAYLRFIPDVSGTYTLTSSYASSGRDPYCTMLADDMTTELAVNDNSNGSLNFSLTHDLIQGKTYFFACTDQNVSSSSYQVLLTYDAPLAPLEAAPGTNTVIDNENGLIYGIAPNVNAIGDYLTAKSGYTFTCTPSGAAGGTAVYSTGSLVTVYADGYWAARYTVVLFGDVDGNGWYDGYDAYLVRLAANGMISASALNDAQRMAADCDHNGSVNAADAAVLERAGLLLRNIDQTVTQAGLETNSVYIEYLSAIDQTPLSEEEPTEVVFAEKEAFFGKLLSFIRAILLFFRNRIMR